MKGIVFREFLEMVEEAFGMDVADRIIEESELPSGGAYTSVATYDHHEILTLVGKLHEQTQVPVPDLVRAFGRHLFHRFVALYPGFFVGVPSAFALLQRIDGIIHVEVRKLYPDAELPVFDCEPLGSDRLVMTYRSRRPFADLAEGLIQGCIEYYKEPITIERENLEATPGETRARFLLTKRSAE
jgi:hypothetical protein